MPTPTLEEFAQAIPVCEQTSGLAAVLEIFRSTGCETIVVVSEQQHPLGIIKLRQILPYLLSPQQLGETPLANPIRDFYKPVSELKLAIIEPLAILPAQLSLSQFWAYLQQSSRQEWESSERGESRKAPKGENFSTQTQDFQQIFPPSLPHADIAQTNLKIQNSLEQHWGLVDGEGKFLGLLNSWLLLKYLAPNLKANEGSAGTAEKSELTGLKPLVQLLEQLPLPLSIQTATGQVLAQNLTWRQQIGTLPELGWVRCTTAAMLDSPAVEHRSAIENNPVPEKSATLPRSALTVGNALQQWYKPSAQAPIQRYCAIDTPRLAATGTKSRAILSAPPASQTQETASSWEASVPASQSRKKNQQRVFSFVKIPLSPLLVKEMGRGVEGENRQDITPSSFGPFTSDLYVVLAQDTTEQQQVTKELAAKNAELVQLNRLKDEFLACISHELKTPLTAVLGLSTLLKDQALGKLNERQVRYARLIYQSGRQLMTVVNDILDLTRMETGQLELTLEPVKIQTACDRAYSQMRQLQQEKDQEDESTQETRFTLQIEPGLEMLVADELRLRQMLGHLLSNAFKFTDPGGEIGLRVNRWEGWIAFSVWDTGIGIPSEKQHLIFQKFQQLEQPHTRRFEGTGLGLALTQHLARLHGGDVSFISKAGEGSEFTLLLPSCPPQVQAQELKVEGGLNVDSSNLSNRTYRSGNSNAYSFKEGQPLGTPTHHANPPRYPSGNAQDEKPSNLPGPKRYGQMASANALRELTQKGTPTLAFGNGFAERERLCRTENGLFEGAQPATLANRNCLVLIVETVPRYLESLTEYLNSLGYRVVIARSGPEAIEKARRLQPHAVFLNPLLPQLSGWDVLTLLKSDAQTQHIPVLVTATQAEKQQAARTKADGFLSLPVQKQALLESLTGLGQYQRPTRSSLTILHLSPDLDRTCSDSSVLSAELTDLLSLQHSQLNYRVLEADNLEQAELLARVWHPDVILLDSSRIADPLTYLKQFSLHTGLTSLPLVTLNHQTTEAANQVTGLSVYPCLAPEDSSKVAALLQVIEVATGMVRKPSILVVEVSAAQEELEKSKVKHPKSNKTLPQRTRRRNSSDSLPVTSHSCWLQALIQYLQTAGFRTSLSSSWAEVYRQIQAQSVDLLIIRVKEVSDSAALMKKLMALEKLQKLPPILVLDHRLEVDSVSSAATEELALARLGASRASARSAQAGPLGTELAVATSEASQWDEAVSDRGDSSYEFESLLRSIATQILRGPSQSMTQLLDRIYQTLAN